MTDPELDTLATEIYWHMEHGRANKARAALRQLIDQREEARKARDLLHNEQCVTCDGCGHGFPLREMVDSRGFNVCPSCYQGEQP